MDSKNIIFCVTIYKITATVDKMTTIVERGTTIVDNPKPKPLDIIVFRGTEFVSAIIAEIQEHALNISKSGGVWTHVGLCVDNTVLDLPQLKPGKLYVLEAVFSTDDCPDVISGRGDFGVQIRDYDELMTKYSGRIGFASLLAYADKNTAKAALTKLWHKEEDTVYSFNCFNMCAAMFAWCRPTRDAVNKAIPFVATDRIKFCSQLVAEAYNAIGLMNVDPKNVVPMDFLGYEQDHDGVPVNMFGPVVTVKNN